MASAVTDLGPIALLVLLVVLITDSGYRAQIKGRNARMWGLLVLLFGPIAWAVLLILPAVEKSRHLQPKSIAGGS